MAENQGTPVSEQELMNQLLNAGSKSGFQKTPLLEFIGTLSSITGLMVQRGQMKTPKLEVTYNFEEVEVIRTTEPYPFPIAQLSIMYSDTEKSLMGVFWGSASKIVNVDQDGNPVARLIDGVPNPEYKNQDFLKGKKLTLKWTSGHMMWNGDAKDATHPKGQDVAREAWEVTSVEGEGSPTPTPVVGTPATKPASNKTPQEQALALLSGKTEQQFYQAVFAEPAFKTASHQAIVQEIIQRKFLAPLEASGKVIKDANGIYSVA